MAKKAGKKSGTDEFNTILSEIEEAIGHGGMNRLGRIEQLRKEFVNAIVEITGLPVDHISVEVVLSSQGSDSDLVAEAIELDWYSDKHKETAWYTTEKPQGGATVIYMNE